MPVEPSQQPPTEGGNADHDDPTPQLDAEIAPDVNQLVQDAVREAVEANRANNRRSQQRRQVNSTPDSVIIPDRIIDDKGSDDDESSVGDDKKVVCGITRRRFVQVSFMVAFLLVAIISISTIVSIGNQDKMEVSPNDGAVDDQGSKNPPSFSPSHSVSPTSSPAPSSTPSSLPTLSTFGSYGQLLLPGVDVYSLPPASAEYRALEWIVFDKHVELNTTTELLERYALAVLYLSTDGERWRPNNDHLWLTAAVHHCQWRNVECSAVKSGNVLSLELKEDISLRGTLPPQLGYLKHLEELSITWDTGLVGTLPTELGKMTSLTMLQLWRTSLIKTIPLELGKLTKLQRLIIVESDLSGDIPRDLFVNMTDLRQLSLDSSGIGGFLPSEIFALTGLEAIELGYCYLSGTIPSTIGMLTSLTNVNLLGNSLSGSIPSEIGLLTGLQFLSLATNNFIGSLPSEIGNLDWLQSLNVFDNYGLEGTVPSEYSQLSSIKEFTLIRTNITGGLETLFCDRPQQLGHFESDCDGPDAIICGCCTACGTRGKWDSVFLPVNSSCLLCN